MNRPLSLILFVVGVILVVYGVNAAGSVKSDVSRVFTGAPTDRTMWLLIAGTILSTIGLAGSLRRDRSRLG